MKKMCISYIQNANCYNFKIEKKLLKLCNILFKRDFVINITVTHLTMVIKYISLIF